MHHPAIGVSRTLTPAEKGRAFGTIIGAAVGDALGAPFEFREAGLYRQRFAEPVLGGRGEMIGGGGFGWAPGEFTDDTQMAVALAEALLAAGTYDPDTVWRWFRAWSTTAIDMGIATSNALSFDDWRAVRHSRPAAGNGALMRAFVLAVAFLDVAPDELRQVVLHQSALTHDAPAAGEGAWIAVEMLRTAINGGDPLAVLPRLFATLSDGVRTVFEPLLSAEWRPGGSTARSNGTVWGCLAEAVYCLRTTHSFEEAVVAAVNMGDDTDTVACVTGALAGALYGVQAIPARWTTYVNGWITGPVGRLDYTYPTLQALATRLLGVSEPHEPANEPAAGPTEVAAGVFAANLLGAASAPQHWAVVSLCRTGDVFAQHSVRRQVFLIDKEGAANPALEQAVRDAVCSIEAFRADGVPVVVHCHGGHSRTGLVLKAWHMHTTGATERDAHDWLAARWDQYQDYNRTFIELLRSFE